MVRGVEVRSAGKADLFWIPACAGMTGGGRVGAFDDPSRPVSSPPRKRGSRLPPRAPSARAPLPPAGALSWIPACAGMTDGSALSWIPAFAGMTGGADGGSAGWHTPTPQTGFTRRLPHFPRKRESRAARLREPSLAQGVPGGSCANDASGGSDANAQG